MAAEGEHFHGALAVARRLGLATERALALFFDASVQQGPQGAMRVADRLVRKLQAKGETRVHHRRLLELYARECARPFRRQSPPSKPYPSEHIEWRKTGSEWHAWAGQFDLYVDVLRRRIAIVKDANLRDQVVRL